MDGIEGSVLNDLSSRPNANYTISDPPYYQVTVPNSVLKIVQSSGRTGTRG